MDSLQRLNQNLDKTPAQPFPYLDTASDERLRFELMLSDLSGRFVKVKPEEVDKEIERALRQVLFFFDGDRCGLLAVQPDRKLTVTHACYADGIQRIPDSLDLGVVFPWTYDKLMRGEHVSVERVSELPAEADRDRQTWTAMGVKSSLSIPLFTSKQPDRIIVIGVLRQERIWPEEYIPRLRLLGEIFVNALARKASDEALRTSEERLNLAAAAANVGLWEWEIGTGGYWRTAKAQEMFGFPADQEIRAGDIFARIHPDDIGPVRQSLQEAIDKGTENNVEYRVLLPDGTVRWMMTRGRRIAGSSGAENRVMGVTVDITERKRSEQALCESQARMSAVVEFTNDLIFSVDAKRFGLLTFNGALRRYFKQGHNLDIQVGMAPEDLLPPDYARQWHELYNRTLREGGLLTEYRTSASARVLLLSFNLLKQGNQVFGISVFGQDITGRKRAEEELRQSEERFRQVAESVSDFIWEVDANGLYTYTSPAVEKILGYRPEEMVGKMHFYDLFPPESRQELKAAGFAVFSEKQSFRSFPNANISKSGQIVHLETSGAPLLDSSGSLIGYRGADTDVTTRREMDEQLQLKLQEIERLKQELERENVLLRSESTLMFEHGRIIGESPAIRRILSRAEQVAKTDSTVLIMGETGTGKELLALEIHNLSSRRDRPLVTVNCSCLPPTLIESELFGREKGAYTGALTRMAGRFEIADGSTIFLDEIGELPLELQVKLLRVIEEGTFERLGSTKTIRANVRLIAATNRDLAQAVRQGTFRQDLYYRLNVFPILVPPLRERAKDIPLLAWAFIRQFEKKMGKQIESIPKRSMDALQRHSWHGNIRELKNVIEHAMIVTTGTVLTVHLPAVSGNGEADANLEDAERKHILSVLEKSGWRISGESGAAGVLGVKRTTLQSKMKKLGLKRPTHPDQQR